MDYAVAIDPLIEPPALLALGLLISIVALVILLSRLRGGLIRILATGLVFLALMNPSLDIIETESVADVLLVLADQSASQSIGSRRDRTRQARESLIADASRYSDLNVAEVEIGNAEGGAGTQLMASARREVAAIGKGQIAAAILVTDGLSDDRSLALDLDVPVHVLLSGNREERDRQVMAVAAPAFAVQGEPFTVTFRIEDHRPQSMSADDVQTTITLNGEIAEVMMVPIGRDVVVRLDAPRTGSNIVLVSIPTIEGELTEANNSASFRVIGVRERLQVLMISGKPHAGQRTWRNLLKSDGAVDLVHFTILRGPGKEPRAEIEELALIEFPVRELFVDKLDDFDLVIFDRYQRFGFLDEVYFQFIARFVENGGAVLIAAGPEFAGQASLAGTDLRTILPASPTGRVLEEGFRPHVTQLGKRHPVTASLPGYDRFAQTDPVAGDWGRWFRLIEVAAEDSDILMSGADGQPLLAVRRVGDGRAALLASDQAWLWDRKVDGGGPQLELLRWLAHWMLQEPGLEEEALSADNVGATLTVRRRTLSDSAPDFEILAPDGTRREIAPRNPAPGEFEVSLADASPGLYLIRSGALKTYAAVGPEFPGEFADTVSNPPRLDIVAARTGGSLQWIADGIPELRPVRGDRQASGRGWIGFSPRNQQKVLGIERYALLLGLTASVLLLGLASLAWWREGAH